MIAVVIAAVLTGVLSTAGVSLFRRRAAAWGLIDVPNDRSLHVTPVPRGAGAVIGICVVGALAILGITQHVGTGREAAVFGVPTLAILILGWMDDRRSLSAGLRLIVQVAIAVSAVMVLGGYRVLALPGLPPFHIALTGMAVTVIWLVGLVNAYNFMDGIDGLAAGQSLVTACAWVVAGMLLDASFVVTAASLIGAASAGFLVHNWSPARVFLGDAGSNFLGLSFAMLPLTVPIEPASGRLPVAAMLFVGVFVVDTVFTFTRRLLSGENVLQAHRTHLYQRLIACGYSHAAVAAWWLFLAAISSTAGVLYLNGGFDLVVVLSGAAVAAAMFGSVQMAEARRGADIVNRSGDANGRTA